ncbi:PIG-L family deacetylase [Streptomyces vinaceus]|uniref:PIG-L family deacetylase n=1 Tax=Streptomyces vinaceus TaxID=1960 RepID=UPI0035D57077
MAMALGLGADHEARAAERTSPAGADGSIVQVVAHPDDDLFFMNPDVSRSMALNAEVTTVYLTSGESDGRNEARGIDPPRSGDRAAFAEARQNGIRGAYAQMATGDRRSAWTRTVIPTAGGGQAEMDVLTARPEINLVWMQLREARSVSADSLHSLRGLWDGRITALGTQLTSGTPVKRGSFYTKAGVADAVAGLFDLYKPTTIRMQDPTAGNSETGVLLDHQDHIYGARFVQAAVERYARTVERPHFAVQNYVGYPNGSLPPTLDPRSASEKLSYLKTYAWVDHQQWCGSPAGCGDRKTAAHPTGYGWSQSMRSSRGGGTAWLTEGASGRLWAFAVLDGQMAYWTRDDRQTVWQGPRFLAGTGIDTGATVARLPDGRVAVFATQTTLGQRHQDYRRDVVYSLQTTAGGAFGPWQSLGSPDTGDLTVTSAISAPAVSVDRSGRMAVYVRDSMHQLRVRTQSSAGAFQPWESLGGAGLCGDPVVATDGSGHSSVYVATSGSVEVWTQTAGDAPPKGPFTTGLPQTTGSLDVIRSSSGDRIAFRLPGTNTVEARMVPAAGSSEAAASTGMSGGLGRFSAAGVPRRFPTVSAIGSRSFSVMVLGQQPWSSRFAGVPAAVRGPDGITTSAFVGLDADLHVSGNAVPMAGAAGFGPRSLPSLWHRAVWPWNPGPQVAAPVSRMVSK